MSAEKANQPIDQSMAEYKSGSSPKKYHSILLFSLGFLIVGLLLHFLFDAEPLSSHGQVVTPRNRGELSDQSAENDTDDANYEVVMSSHWYFTDGSALSENAYVENSSRNTNTVYFTVTRTDTGDIIYISPRIPPDSYIDSIQLSLTPGAGDYDTILTYYLLDETDSVVSTIPMKLLITVEN